MSAVDRAALIEVGARAIGDPDDFSFAGERDGRAEGCRTLAEDILAAALPLLANALEAKRAEHFAEYGNEETGPRNYDWALTHAADLVRSLLSTDNEQ